MIINPVKKTQVLLDKLKQSADKAEGQAYSDANPFFSWHANHIVVNRKKIIILVNDLTLLPLIINDINAKAKPELDKIIETGIREMFSLIGVRDKDIDLYFKYAGEIEVNAAYNRKTIGHINNYLYSFREIDLSERYPFELSLFLGDSVQMKLKNYNSITETLDVFTNDDLFNNYSKKDYDIKKNWEPFSKWSKYEEEKEWFEGYDNVANELRENNSKLLSSFESYLIKKENMSKDAVEIYISILSDYTDIYLVYYNIGTVLTNTDNVRDFLSDFYSRKFMWADETSLKETSRALRKLYKFLYEAEEIDTADFKIIKSRISDGTIEGLERMKNMGLF